MARVAALIPCAGQGKRMGGAISKPYITMFERPLLCYTLDTFQGHPLIDEIILMAQSGEVEFCQKEIVEKYQYSKVRSVISGGKERQDSVALGLGTLDSSIDWVVIHDGVRPLLTADTLTRALENAFEKGSAVVGVPAKDTIKRVDPSLRVQETPERQYLWQVQTPQIFRKAVLDKAYQEAGRCGWQGTDDASLVERLGENVYMVKGEYSNIKVTTPDDLIYCKEMLRLKK